MERKVYLHNTKYAQQILNEFIKENNDICEDQRNYEGQDDEPEDEMASLL
jgi:hypothetical protein